MMFMLKIEAITVKKNGYKLVTLCVFGYDCVNGADVQRLELFRVILSCWVCSWIMIKFGKIEAFG